MTIKQYSDLQRMLGNIEGAALSLTGPAASVIMDAVEAIEATLDEVMKEERE